MAWIRLDDHFDEHPKIQSVGPLATALWVASIAYCNRNLTDGFVPFGAAHRLLALEFLDPKSSERGRSQWRCAMVCGMAGFDGDELVERLIDMLLESGLWEHEDGGYRVHDYLDHQSSKTQVVNARKSNAQRQSRHRLASTNAVTNAVSNACQEVRSKKEEARIESKERKEGVSAAAFAKAKRLYPDRDIELLEAKLLEYHSRRPYRSLDRALLSWCARAKKAGTEALADRNGAPVQETMSQKINRLVAEKEAALGIKP